MPFYLRSGGYLAEKSNEIVIQIKQPSTLSVADSGVGLMCPNILSFCLRPDEGFHQLFDVKLPDTMADRRLVEMAFHYRDAFGESVTQDFYERLLLDALNGDTSLFTRGDRVELAWELVDPLLKVWKEPAGPQLLTYTPGSWGPSSADHLFERDGRNWTRVRGVHPKVIGPSGMT